MSAPADGAGMSAATTTARLRLRRGDVVAVALPPGEAWLSVVSATWAAEASLLPVDHRLPGPAERDLLADARPTVLVSGDGWRRVTSGRPADPAVALIVPTSGSSGRPRLVELTRSAVEAAVASSLRALGAGAGDGWVSCLPFAHIGGLLVLMRGLLGGAPLVFRGPGELEPVAGFPFVSVVPTQLVRALDAGVDLRGHRALLVGGGGMDAALRGRASAAEAPCVVTYGLTQSCGGVVYDGKPLPGVSVRIAEGGEIQLGGPTLLRGYRDGSGAGLTPGRLAADGRRRRSGRRRPAARPRTARRPHRDRWRERLAGGRRDRAAQPPHGRRLRRLRPSRPLLGAARGGGGVPARGGAAPTLEELRDHVGALLGRLQAPRELVLVAYAAAHRQAGRELRRAGLAVQHPSWTGGCTAMAEHGSAMMGGS